MESRQPNLPPPASSGSRRPIVPAAGFHFLTPCYDLLCPAFGLGRGFQQDVVARLDLREGERVLDVGCGTGTLLTEVRRRCPRVEAVGVDADPGVLRIARRRLCRSGMRDVPLQVARAEALPFAGGTFDVVVTTLTFHHLPTGAKQAGLGEFHRVLRPGGRMLLVDFGARPGGRMSLWQRLVERAEYLEDHLRGRIPVFMEAAGFRDVQCLRRRRSSVEYWAARRTPSSTPGGCVPREL